MEWKESKLPVLVEHLKAIVNQHEGELEKAVIGRGEWKFTARYKHLEVDDNVWFPEMNAECQQKHMKKVKSCKLMVEATDVSNTSVEKPNLSVSLEALHTRGTISLHTLQCMWNAASNS